MTEERDKPSGVQESLARTTARDVPFVRGAGTESEPAPHGQRPAALPRDPTYEAELAQVELAVLRDRDRRDDPSTKQGGRRGYQPPPPRPPESITPESPGARAEGAGATLPSPEAPRSSGRSVASGTLLSVGAVDPRGKTEPTLETPRMYFSQAEPAGGAYFKPGKIPAVTVHQTIETETVKLADSIDPRRAKTLPRIDRAALMRYAEREVVDDPESELPPSEESSSPAASDAAGSARWNELEQEPEAPPSELDDERQIHASLSPFRDQAEPSFNYGGVPTRAEPLAGLRALRDTPPPPPDPATVPTQRDLPQHRIEASRPPPPPPPSSIITDPPLTELPGTNLQADVGEPSTNVKPFSDGPTPTTASITADELRLRPIWQNFAAFMGALVAAVALGWWLTNDDAPRATLHRPGAASPAPSPPPSARAGASPLGASQAPNPNVRAESPPAAPADTLLQEVPQAPPVPGAFGGAATPDERGGAGVPSSAAPVLSAPVSPSIRPSKAAAVRSALPPPTSPPPPSAPPKPTRETIF